MFIWHLIRHNLTLRAASGDLLVGETSDEEAVDKTRVAEITLNVTKLTLADVADEVDFYFQTKLNGAWVDVANVHFSNAHNGTTPSRIIGIGPKAAGVVVYTPSDGTLADNTDQDIPVGEALRIKTVVTKVGGAPVYAYTAKVTLIS